MTGKSLSGPHNDRGLAVKRILVFILPVLLILLAVAGTMIMGALVPDPEEKESEITAAPVLVAEAFSEDTRLSISTQGEVRPRTEISIVPQVSGKIAFISPTFLEGGAFKQGDLLLQVEQREYQLRVVQARANVARSQTKLTSEKAEAEIAKRDWQEMGREATEISALALREPQLAEARAALASANAALGEAQLNLDRSSIRAPFDGRVRTKKVDFGQYITPGSNLGEIYAVQIMDVPLSLTDDELGQLGLDIGFIETETNRGPEAILTARVAGRERLWRGRVARTDSGYDAKTRTLFAYVEVIDPYGAGAANGAPLAPGLFVNAQIMGKSIASSVIIPRTALRGNDQVYIAKSDDTMEIRKVTVASSDRKRAVITDGLKVGEKVVTSPVRGAGDGMKIAIVDRAKDDKEKIVTAADGQDDKNSGKKSGQKPAKDAP